MYRCFMTHPRLRNQSAEFRLALPILFGGILVLILSLAVTRCALAGNSGGTDVVRVEEDWELDVSYPNTNDSAPQLMFLISPTSDTNSYYAIFTLNKRDGAVGGLELTIWNGNTLLARTTSSNTASLATDGEKIQWTTRLTIDKNNNLTAEVFNTNGSTKAWGNFDLSVSTGTNLSNLNGYDITGTLSANNSQVDFGNTRVSKLMLQQIRTYTGSGNNSKVTSQLGSAKTVYQYP